LARTSIIERLFSPRRDDIFAKASLQAEAGRRLAIYDRVTGFLAPWYMRLRASEEWDRSVRYERPLSLLMIEAPDSERDKLNSWLARERRKTDLVCRGADGAYFVLLTETDQKDASELAKRIISEFASIHLSSAGFPFEKERFESLLTALGPEL